MCIPTPSSGHRPLQIAPGVKESVGEEGDGRGEGRQGEGRGGAVNILLMMPHRI